MRSSFMKSGLITFVFILAAAVFASGQSVSGSIGSGNIDRGKSAKGTVVISVPAGLHINSNKPNSPYAIATTVKVTSPGARLGSVSYPRGSNRKFAFSENTINVYQGR